MLEKLERRTKFMGTEVVTLKDAVWRLTKRVTSLEHFILKQFGSSSNALDADEDDFEDMVDIYASGVNKKDGQAGSVTSNDASNSDNDDGDSTYSPYKTRTIKRKQVTTRYGRISKLKQRQNVTFVDVKADEVNHDHDQEDSLDISAMNSCEVNMMEPGDAENGSSENIKVSKLKIVDGASLERFTCPECSTQFNGKTFLQIHLKKVHPNLRVIVQSIKTKPVPVTLPKTPSKTKSCQTKEDDEDKIIPPEVASRIVKYSVRVGSNAKQATLNGYSFSSNHTHADRTYWRCTEFRTDAECTASMVEKLADGTFRRGSLGWAADGITHVSHAPDFKKIEIYLRRAEAIDNGWEWDRKKKIGRVKKDRTKKIERTLKRKAKNSRPPHPVAVEPRILDNLSVSPEADRNTTDPVATPIGTPFGQAQATSTNPITPPTFGNPYTIPGFPLAVPHTLTNSNFTHHGQGHYSHL